MKFLQTIDKSFIGRLIDKKLNVLDATDPDRIYVENIRSFYNLPPFFAKLLCEMAVKEGAFLKYRGIICPNSTCGKLIKSVSSTSKFPNSIKCQTCELLEEDQYEFDTQDCKIVEFYKLNR